MPKLWQRKLWAEKAANAQAQTEHSQRKSSGSGSMLAKAFGGQSLRDLVPPEPPTLGDMTWEFLEETSSHGLGEVVNPSWLFGPNPKSRRVLWFLVWVGFLSYWAYYANSVIGEFLTYPSVSSVQTTNAASAPFPAISFCSLSPTLHEGKSDLGLRDTSQMTTGLLTHEHLKAASGLWTLPPIMWKCAFTTGVSCQPRMDGDRVVAGDGTWTTFIDGTFGSCFTFHPETLRPAGVDVVLGRNPKSGLELELKILQEHYPSFVKDVGFVVKAHDRNNTMPVMSSGSVVVRPGQKTEIRMTRKEYSELGYPYHGAETDNDKESAATCCHAINPVGMPYTSNNPSNGNGEEVGEGWKGYSKCRKKGSWDGRRKGSQESDMSDTLEYYLEKIGGVAEKAFANAKIYTREKCLQVCGELVLRERCLCGTQLVDDAIFNPVGVKKGRRLPVEDTSGGASDGSGSTGGASGDGD
eukprot:g5513.t1